MKPLEETPLGLSEDREEGTMRRLAARALHPVAIAPPTVDRQLTRLGPVERGSEVIRFSVRRFEYWLSPRGSLREWLRFSLKLALFIGIPLFLLGPVVTLLLKRSAEWSTLLVDVSRNLALIPAWLGTGLLGIVGIIVLFRLISGR